MLIDSINLNVLRVFERVYSLRSMTQAAAELHLTQSGVSQHIYNLESSLNIKLFDRVKKQLIPTDKGHHLYKVCSKSLDSIEEELWQLRGTKRELAGKVTVGMPTEFGQNIVGPLLTDFLKTHPDVSVHVVLDFAPVINQGLINGNIDFAFVDDFTTDPRIRNEKIYEEVLDLCISPTLLKKYKNADESKAFFEDLDYIEYFEGEPVLRQWLNRKYKFRDINLKIRTYVSNPKIVAGLILGGVGAGVLPDHLYKELTKSGENLVCLGPNTGKSITNTIHIAHLNHRTLSTIASELKSYLAKKISQRTV